LRVQGAWNKQAPDWDQAFQGGFVSYSTAVVFTVPIFTGGALFSSPAEARHAKAQAELKADRGVLMLRDDVEGAILDVRSLRKSVESLALSREQFEEIARLELKSYALGKATISELLSAQNDLIASKVELARAKIDLSVQLKQLAWNLGLVDGHE
jgi:outer membrane protein